MKQFSILLFFLFRFVTLCAQPDSSWNVLLMKKGSNYPVNLHTAHYNAQGFYLYKNCVYEITLKNKTRIGGRLVGIKPDTLFFTNHFNANEAAFYNQKLDTFGVYYKELDKLNLIADRAMGWYMKNSFDNFDFIFKKDTIDFLFKSDWARIFDNDTARYEIVPHLTAQGLSTLFEENGKTYFFYGGGMTKPDPSKIDDTYDVKNVFWFTPSKVEEINGLAIGLDPKNTKNSIYNMRDSLIIRGLNLVINPFAIFSLMNPRFNGPCPDSLSIYKEYMKKDWYVKVNGVNISLVNSTREMRIKGLNITGLITVVDEIHGVTLSGINNFSYILNGLSIAVIRNRATFAKGVQIALFNKANELRGFQFGLWNINGRRSLPFINWQFRPNRKRPVK